MACPLQTLTGSDDVTNSMIYMPRHYMPHPAGTAPVLTWVRDDIDSGRKCFICHEMGRCWCSSGGWSATFVERASSPVCVTRLFYLGKMDGDGGQCPVASFPSLQIFETNCACETNNLHRLVAVSFPFGGVVVIGVIFYVCSFWSIYFKQREVLWFFFHFGKVFMFGKRAWSWR